MQTKLGHVKKDSSSQPKHSSDTSQAIKPVVIPGPPAQVAARVGECEQYIRYKWFAAKGKKSNVQIEYTLITGIEPKYLKWS